MFSLGTVDVICFLECVCGACPDLELFSKHQLVDVVGHVWALGLGCGAVCRHMEVSWYLQTHVHTQAARFSLTRAPATHLVN